MLAASNKIFTLCFDTLGDWKITSTTSYRKLWMWTKSITLYVKEHSLNKLFPVLMWIFFEPLERSLDRIIFNHISSRSTSPLTREDPGSTYLMFLIFIPSMKWSELDGSFPHQANRCEKSSGFLLLFFSLYPNSLLIHFVLDLRRKKVGIGSLRYQFMSQIIYFALLPIFSSCWHVRPGIEIRFRLLVHVIGRGSA